MSRLEYRVIWQREGQEKKRALYQTRAGAERCAQRQRTAREEMTWLEEDETEYLSAPDRRPHEIVFGPIIEEREVGAWKELSDVE